MRFLFLFFLFYNFAYAISFSHTNKLVAKLDFNKFSGGGNVLQGIAHIDNLWIFSQTSNNKELHFTFTNLKQVSYRETLKYKSHGQDLDLICTNKHCSKFDLVTLSNNHDNNIAIFSVDLKKKHKIRLKKEISLHEKIRTVSLSVNKQYLVLKVCNDIEIFSYREIINQQGNARPIFKFHLNLLQQKKDQWLQGLIMKDGYIYTISGNNKLSGKKYLVIYDMYGMEVKQFVLKTGKKYAQKEGLKWELEGLDFHGNKLYTSVMSGKNGHNIKRVYQILELKY